MINGKDLYQILTEVVPLYIAMILAYGSVKWWKIFTPNQCSGINRFVALFAVPLLSFQFISNNNPYTMNYRFIAADTLQKIIVLIFLTIWANFTSKGSIEWSITLFSLSSLPNTLVMGIPLMGSMYGEFSSSLMVQIVVLQCIIWYTLMLFLFEYRGAKVLISQQFPDNASSIGSVKVDSDVFSLDGLNPLETRAELGQDGKLHVTVRKSTSFRSEGFSTRVSNAEIYSLHSSRNATPRGSSFNLGDSYPFVNGKGLSTVCPVIQDFGSWGFDVENSGGGGGRVLAYASKRVSTGGTTSHLVGPARIGKKKGDGGGNGSGNGGNSGGGGGGGNGSGNGGNSGGDGDNSGNSDGSGGSVGRKDINMFVWSSSPSFHVSEGLTCSKENQDCGGNGGRPTEAQPNTAVQGEPRPTSMPPASVMTRLILTMVWRKLIRNPNTYSSLISLIWSLISFRWHVTMPKIILESVKILSNTGLGMAMFSLGLFMALQPKLIACGNAMAAMSMAVRFIVGPAVIVAASVAMGLKGNLLRIAIVQAALPQGIVPFVFAKEYNVHPDILSTAVIFGMLVALPITLIYYVLLGL